MIFIQTTLVLDLFGNLVFKEKGYICQDGERRVTGNLVSSFQTISETHLPSTVLGTTTATDEVTPDTRVPMLLNNMLVQCQLLWQDGWTAYRREECLRIMVRTVVDICENLGGGLGPEAQNVWEAATNMEQAMIYYSDPHIPRYPVNNMTNGFMDP
jgi:hypothetical protein